MTFLFTDIELSTQTIDAIGAEAYADALDTHRQVLRDAFKKHGGHEVGTEGDAFFVAFSRAGEAVAAAIEGQQALDGHLLHVRMGMHTGEALVRAGEYFGHDVHKAKRICDAGHGMQILLSQTTADIVGASVALRDLGAHRLKDLGEPQRIFQVGDREFPPLRSLESFRHNLPTQRTAFIGRESEIAEITRLLENERLVTLTGVGGCGKTRLAQQVGAELVDRYQDGVFFVDLAQLADPDVVTATIAAAINVPVATEIGTGLRTTTENLLHDFLAQRQCLVILDNCEHLLDACAEIADRILAVCPGVTLLATSREALDVEGEQPWRVPSLSLPANGDVQSSEAVSLFKSRAKTVRPDFELTPQNIGAVVEVCRRLDGIPLAIEFAAARVSHLSPQEIAARLGDMFKLLAGGRRRRMQRQHTLQASLDWSYELLSESEGALLRRLSVFPASFTLEAAEGICSGDGIDRSGVLDLLGSLVAKSLVTTHEHEGTTRYRLIETVRFHANEKLREAGGTDTYRTRHRDWYLDWIRSFHWGELLWGELLGGDISGVGGEHANLRAALEWSESEDRPELVVTIASRMRAVWSGLGYLEDGLRWLTIAPPEELELSPDERVAALALAFFVASEMPGEGESELLERAIAAGAGTESTPLAWALYGRALTLAVMNRITGDPQLAEDARRVATEADRMAERVRGTGSLVAEARGVVELTLGDNQAAAEIYASSPIRPSEDQNLLARATVAHVTGDDQRAVAAAERFVQLRDRLDHSLKWLGIFGMSAAAAAFAGVGETNRAKTTLRESFDSLRRSGRPDVIEDVAVGAAAIAYATGDYPSASRLLAWVRSRTFDLGRLFNTPIELALYQHYVRLVRAALDRADARRYLAEGRAMSEDEGIGLVLEILGS